MKSRNELTKYLRMFRQTHEMTQYNMCKRLNISYAYYGNLEQGRRCISQKIANKLFALCSRTDSENRRNLLDLINLNNNEIYVKTNIYKTLTHIHLDETKPIPKIE